MFTGLVEETGTVASIQRQLENARLLIDARATADDTQIGDSICVNGCCLTVVELVRGESDSAHRRLAFDVVPETLQRTNLGQLTVGDRVNLERSLKPDTRMGGHFVTGHIDGTAKVAVIDQRSQWRIIGFSVEYALTRQMASKGSVTVDGISLTLVDVTDQGFTVALIPHTLAATTIGQRRVGDSVNIETDLLAKYVQRQLATRNDP